MPRRRHLLQTWDQPRQIVGGPQADGLLAAWPLAEGGGAVAYDLVGRNSGTAYGSATAPTSAPGPFGVARSFDGSTQYVSIATPSEIIGAYAGSLSVWIYATTLSSGPNYTYQKQAISLGEALFLIETNTGGWDFGIHTGGFYEAISSTSYVADTWVHLAGTYDGSYIRLYVNGALAATTAATGALSPTFGQSKIGAFAGSLSRIFAGRLQDARVYGRALSAAEIQSLYADPLALIRPASRMHYLSAAVLAMQGRITAAGSARGGFAGAAALGARATSAGAARLLGAAAAPFPGRATAGAGGRLASGAAAQLAARAHAAGAARAASSADAAMTARATTAAAGRVASSAAAAMIGRAAVAASLRAAFLAGAELTVRVQAGGAGRMSVQGTAVMAGRVQAGASARMRAIAFPADVRAGRKISIPARIRTASVPGARRTAAIPATRRSVSIPDE